MYYVGDVVYQLNQATKLGQSAKLKSPWKGPYLITAWRSPVLYKITESWIHHDRIKFCEDRELPIWIKRLRNQLMDQIMKPTRFAQLDCQKFLKKTLMS